MATAGELKSEVKWGWERCFPSICRVPARPSRSNNHNRRSKAVVIFQGVFVMALSKLRSAPLITAAALSLIHGCISALQESLPVLQPDLIFCNPNADRDRNRLPFGQLGVTLFCGDQ